VERIYARRLARSHLNVRAPGDLLLDVVRDVLGVHAQLMTAAELSLSARIEGVTRATVPRLLWQTRELVKGNTIRGTLHLQTPEDFALWKSVYEPRWRTGAWLAWQELTLAEAEWLRESVLSVTDEPRTRVEIGELIGGRLGKRLAEDSWGHLLSPANSELCHAPPRGRNVTFVRADVWLGAFAHHDRLEALQQLVDRYVATYGPVERPELEHWFAEKLPAEIEIPDAGEFPDAEPHGVRLLPHYDVYVIACHPRDDLIPQEKERIFLKGAGPNPALVVDGRVAGTWKRDKATVTVEPWVELTKHQRAELELERERVSTWARSPGARASPRRR
jgi:hypothetical protein